MSDSIQFNFNKATTNEIVDHFLRCDDDFVRRLENLVDVNVYVNKIYSRALRFEAWVDNNLIGLVAIYCNDPENLVAYITSVSVLKELQGKGVASKLLRQSIDAVASRGYKYIELEVDCLNLGAIKLYTKNNFCIKKINEKSKIMQLYIINEE